MIARALQIVLLILAMLWGFVSCAPKTVVVDPIAPRAVIVRERIKQAAELSNTLQATAKETHAQASGLVQEADRIKAETERLSHLASVGESDWDALKLLAAAHYQATFAHEIKARETANQSDTLATNQAETVKEADQLATQAQATDKATTELKQQVITNNADADKWRALRAILVIGGIMLVILLGGFLYLRLT